MPKIRFSDPTIRTLKAGVHFDAAMPAFAIRVGKNRRTWFIVKGANRTKVRLGHYPALSLAEARRKAHALLSNPLAVLPAPTYTEARNEFLKLHGATLRPRSLYETDRTLKKHFYWTKPISQITHHDILAAIDPLKDTPSEAQHAFKDIRTFFNWCVPRYLKQSPCTGLKSPAKSPSRARVLTDEELARIWRACDRGTVLPPASSAISASTDNPIREGERCALPESFCTIVQLLILTGQRRGEIAALQSSWLNEKEKTITIPATVAKNGREHTFPISSRSLSLVSLQYLKEQKYVFPARGRTDSPFNGWSNSKAALDKASGVTDWTLHDLRRTYASNMARLGVQLPVIEKLLNHVSGSFGGIVSVYQKHHYFNEMKEAIERYENEIKRIVE